MPGADTEVAVSWQPALPRLAGGLTEVLSRPVLVATADGLLAVGRGADGRLLTALGDGDRWSPLRSSGVPVVRGARRPSGVGWDLAACVDDAGRVHLLATSPEGELLHALGDGRSWRPFEDVGAPAMPTTHGVVLPMGLSGPPAACAVGDAVHAFAAGPEGDLLHARWAAGRWWGFASLGMARVRRGDVEVEVPVRPRMTATAVDRERLLVLLRGPDRDLVCNERDCGRWSGFTSLGFPTVTYTGYLPVSVPAALTGEPSACSWGAGRVDVVARGPSGELLHRSWDGTTWGTFRSMGMPTSPDGDPVPLSGDVTCCAPEPGRVHVLAAALDGRLHHAALRLPVDASR